MSGVCMVVNGVPQQYERCGCGEYEEIGGFVTFDERCRECFIANKNPWKSDESEEVR
jgi:hypothetical protein